MKKTSESLGVQTVVRVVKVGGSLLDWPPLPAVLPAWLAAQRPAVNVLICGGGPLADFLRRADRNFRLGEEKSHWLCIDLMAMTARVLASILPQAQFCDRYSELLTRIATGQPGIVIFDVRQFLIDHEAVLPGCVLPRSWAATSDSIAARVAEVLEAEELVLLKSADPPPAASLADLAACGLVDAHFPRAAGTIGTVRLINIRQAATALPGRKQLTASEAGMTNECRKSNCE